jgi:hypothetical protein
MGIDPMNNISNNNNNTLCSYVISTLPLNKKGILQQHQAREIGQHHQQHQVGERITSSISSWNTDWRIYKSLEVFFIGNIVIHKGMQSSSASTCISITLIYHHHHSMRLAHHYNIGLALRYNYKAGSTVLVLFYVTIVKLEARNSSCFMSQQSSWKQDIRLALRHSCQARSSVLVSSHHLALRHNHQVGSKILILLYVTTIRSEAGY